MAPREVADVECGPVTQVGKLGYIPTSAALAPGERSLGWERSLPLSNK